MIPSVTALEDDCICACRLGFTGTAGRGLAVGGGDARPRCEGIGGSSKVIKFGSLCGLDSACGLDGV